MRRHSRLFCVAVAVLLGVASTASATSIEIQPPLVNTGLGGFSLNVDISGVVDLYGFQFDIAFDPAILQASDILEGAFLPGGGATLYLPGAIDNTLGTITFTADTLFGPIFGVSGGGTLATINFDAVGSGSSAISISNVFLLDSLGTPLNFSATDGLVNVQDIPEPATLSLVCGAGLALFVRRRRAGRSQQLNAPPA